MSEQNLRMGAALKRPMDPHTHEPLPHLESGPGLARASLVRLLTMYEQIDVLC